MPKRLLSLLLLSLLIAPLSAAVASGGTPGLPTSLSIQSAPPSLPANGNTFDSVVVSLKDVHGNPSLAVTPILVNLRSSELNVATVALTVTIPAGHDYVLADVNTTTTPGSTVITASSSGLQSSLFTLNTVTPSGLASQLKVFVAPDTIPDGYPGTLAVELQDAAGIPSKAISPVTVSLTSNEPGIAVPGVSTVTIPAGQYFATVSFETGPESGDAVIYAQSGNFTEGSGPITVVTAEVGTASRLELQGLFEGGAGTGGATTLPADGQQYNVLEVELLDSSGNPVPAPTSITVQLTSSQSPVLSTASTITIQAGSVYTLTQVQTSFLAGTAVISATSPGYTSANATFVMEIPAPSKVTIYVAPQDNILTQGFTPVVAVQLQDFNGGPASARAATSVLVTSSNLGVVSGSFTVNIPMGNDYGEAELNVTGTGTTTLTASASGLSSSETPLQVIAFPLRTSLTAADSTIYVDNTTTLTLNVTLLGEPLVGANVTWISSSGTLSPRSAMLGSGGTTTVTFYPNAAGYINITAVVSDPAVPKTTAFTYVNVDPTPPKAPLTLVKFLKIYGIIIVAPVVAVAGYMAYYLRKRRKKAREELEAAFQNVV